MLDAGMIPSRLTSNPIRHEFNTEFSLVSHVKISKTKPKLLFPFHIVIIINVAILIINCFIIIILKHCVKIVQTLSFFWSIFSQIWNECGDFRVNFFIQSKYRKIRTRKNSVFRNFSPSRVVIDQYIKLLPHLMISEYDAFAILVLYLTHLRLLPLSCRNHCTLQIIWLVTMWKTDPKSVDLPYSPRWFVICWCSFFVFMYERFRFFTRFFALSIVKALFLSWNFLFNSLEQTVQARKLLHNFKRINR